MKTLKICNISKSYRGVPALCNLELTLSGGRVHALMGENGAGKSTLIKLLAGVIPADSIKLLKDGEPVSLTSAQDAHAAGFRFIHQELNIVPQISVAENILLGRRYPCWFGPAINWRSLERKAQEALAFLGADHIPVKKIAGSLPSGDRMLVKIAAAFVADKEEATADLFVFDEPTAALSSDESRKLFKVIERLKNRGAAILYVSHRLDEVLSICDDITVLRDGHLVSTGTVRQTSRNALIHAMTGRDVKDAYPPRTSPIGVAPVVTAKNVSNEHLHGLDFTLHKGEVLGVVGLAGSGQGELLRLLLGDGKPKSGTLAFQMSPAPGSPNNAWRKGIAYIPRERRGEALMLSLSIRSNIVLPHLARFGWLANKHAETRIAEDLCEKVRLKYDSIEQTTSQLSGGNQQKVIFARALFGNPSLLLLDEPTRGVDIGAKFDIYQLVRAQSAKGCAVVLASSDLSEILGMCDRILVLQNGRQTALLSRDNMTSADLLQYFYTQEAA